MNVRCKVCRLGRPFVTAGKLQQVKNSKSKRAPSCWNKLFLPPFLNKWKPCHGAINNWSRKLRTALERHFRYTVSHTFIYTDILHTYIHTQATI